MFREEVEDRFRKVRSRDISRSTWYWLVRLAIGQVQEQQPWALGTYPTLKREPREFGWGAAKFSRSSGSRMGGVGRAMRAEGYTADASTNGRLPLSLKVFRWGSGLS